MKGVTGRGCDGRDAWVGYVLALAAAALWALSATIAKGLLRPGLDAFSLAQTRSLVGFLCLWPVLRITSRSLVALPRRQVRFVALLGLNMALMHASYYYAVSRLPVAVAILVQYLAPLLILGYVRCFRRQALGPGLWTAAGLCLAGCALVSGVLGGVGGMHWDGMASALFSAGAYAAYILLAEAGGRRLPPWTLLCYGLGFAALFWGVARPWWRFPLHTLSPTVGLAVIAIAVCGTVLPFALVGLALRRIAAGPVGIATTAEPVIAAGVAYLILGERIGLMQAAGGLLVLAGIILAQVRPAPTAEMGSTAPCEGA